MLDRLKFLYRAVKSGVPGAAAVLGGVSLVTGLALPAVLNTFHNGRPWLVALGLLLLLVAITEGAYQLKPPPAVPAMIEPTHDSRLRWLVQSWTHQVVNGTRCSFETPLSQAMRAHFPNEADQADEWNHAVGSVEDAETAYRENISSAMESAGISDPPYQLANIRNFLELRSPGTLYMAIESLPGLDPQFFGHEMIGLIPRDGSSGVTIARSLPDGPQLWETEEEAHGLASRVEGLFEQLRSSEEVSAVHTARDHVRALQGPLRESLIALQERVIHPEMACEICRHNAGIETD